MLTKAWLEPLHERKEEGRLRTLQGSRRGIDFWSNDYLGFARHPDFAERLKDLVIANPELLLGATGSRLISGNSEICMGVEEFIARTHGVESALIFASGYSANLALFSSLPKRTDVILMDEKIHRSVIDGCRLYGAKRWKFRHNDLEHLETLMRRSSGQIWVAVESLYSMDGDFAPLADLVALCQQYNAALLVDEAHAIGTFGLGLVAHYGFTDQVFATVVTYGKAMGQAGAAVLGSEELKSYLINFASPFIYSTGLPDIHALGIREAYIFLGKHPELTTKLQDHISMFLGETVEETALYSPIRSIRFSEIGSLDRAVETLSAHDILGYAIKAPTVPQDEEMIRVSLHAFNTTAEIGLLKKLLEEIKNG